MFQILTLFLALIFTSDQPTTLSNPSPIGFYSVESLPAPQKFKATLETLSEAIGVIEITDRQTNRVFSSGTGYILQPGDIAVTAHHVVKKFIDHPDLLKAQLRFDSGETFELPPPSKIDSSLDFVTFGLDRKHKTFLTQAPVSSIEPGLRIFALGYPYQLGKYLTMGTLLETGKENHPWVLTSLSFARGMSGSPIVAFDSEGNIRGVIGTYILTETVALLSKEQGVLFFIQAEALDQLNLKLLTLASSNDLQTALAAQKNEAGQWESPRFMEWWSDLNQPLVVTLHNIMIASNSGQKDEVKKNIQNILKDLSEAKEELKQKPHLEGIQSSVESNLLKAYRSALSLMTSKAIGYNVFVDFPQKTKSEILQQVKSVKDISDAERIFTDTISDFEQTQKSVDELFKSANEKLAFLKSPNEVLKWAIEGKASEDLKKPEFFLNVRQFRLPTFITLNPQ